MSGNLELQSAKTNKVIDSSERNVLVTGAAGFIGHQLCRELKSRGYFVRGVDKDRPQFSTEADYHEFLQLDLRDRVNANTALIGMDRVYALAALNGSIEYTSKQNLEIISANGQINANTAEACVAQGVKRVFFSSSACVYPEALQGEDGVPLQEDLAFTGRPDTFYGVEKLAAEWVYEALEIDHKINVRRARFFNVYGPEGAIDPVRAKAPTAITRKVIEAKDGGEVYIWGEGGQIRSFVYITDCIEAICRLMDSDVNVPVNIGTDDHLSIDQLVDLAAEIEGKRVVKVHQLDKVEGVRNRLCDNTRATTLLGWEPRITPYEGMKKINASVRAQMGLMR